MNCPYCSDKLCSFDEPDESIRAYCCNCKIMVTIHQLDDETVCEEEE